MRLYRNDINQADVSEMKRSLPKETILSNSLKKTIDNFVVESNEKLKGPAWDLIRERLVSVNNCLDDRKANSSDLYNVIDDANKVLFNYMDDGGADIADDAKIPELEARIAELKRLIAIERQGTWVTGTDINGNTYEYLYVDWDAVYAMEAEVAKLQKELDWLKRLKPTVSSTTSSVVSKSLSHYINNINNIRGGK